MIQMKRNSLKNIIKGKKHLFTIPTLVSSHNRYLSLVKQLEGQFDFIHYNRLVDPFEGMVYSGSEEDSTFCAEKTCFLLGKTYAKEILKSTKPEDTVYMVGWSFAGLIAVSVAAELLKNGRSAEKIKAISIDGSVPYSNSWDHQVMLEGLSLGIRDFFYQGGFFKNVISRNEMQASFFDQCFDKYFIGPFQSMCKESKNGVDWLVSYMDYLDNLTAFNGKRNRLYGYMNRMRKMLRYLAVPNMLILLRTTFCQFPESYPFEIKAILCRNSPETIKDWYKKMSTVEPEYLEAGHWTIVDDPKCLKQVACVIKEYSDFGGKTNEISQ